jgi:membrane-associated phospholipid phosphatase
MQRTFVLVLLLVLLSSGGVRAAVCPGEEEPPPPKGADATPSAAAGPESQWKTSARNVGKDATYLLTFPKRVTRRGVIMSSVFTAGLATFILLDQEIQDEIRGDNRMDSINDVEELGGFFQTHLAVAATYGIGKWAGHEPTAETGRAMLEALLFTDVFVGVGKAAFGRDGPDDRDARASDWFSYEDSGRFPSGHTSRAFTLATVLAERHGKVAAWIAYPLATLVGLSLLDSEDHWASDVFAGAGLGYVVGRAVVRRREQRRDERQQRVRLEPVVLQGGDGIGMMVRIPIPQRSARRVR